MKTLSQLVQQAKLVVAASKYGVPGTPAYAKAYYLAHSQKKEKAGGSGEVVDLGKATFTPKEERDKASTPMQKVVAGLDASIAQDLYRRIQADDSLLVFHGTSEAVRGDIRKSGLQPGGGEGADKAFAAINKKTIEAHHGESYARLTPVQIAERKGSVFVATEPAVAKTYADLVSKVGGTTPLVLAIRIPAERAATLKRDEFGPDIRTLGSIPPEWIKVAEFETGRGGRLKGSKITLRDLASPRTLYLVVACRPEQEPRDAASKYGIPGTAEYAKAYYAAHKKSKEGGAAAAKTYPPGVKDVVANKKEALGDGKDYTVTLHDDSKVVIYRDATDPVKGWQIDLAKSGLEDRQHGDSSLAAWSKEEALTNLSKKVDYLRNRAPKAAAPPVAAPASTSPAAAAPVHDKTPIAAGTRFEIPIGNPGALYDSRVESKKFHSINIGQETKEAREYAKQLHKELRQEGFKPDEKGRVKTHSPSQKMGKSEAWSGSSDRAETAYKHPDGRTAELREKYPKYGDKEVVLVVTKKREPKLTTAASAYGKPGTPDYARNYYLAHKKGGAAAAAAPSPTPAKKMFARGATLDVKDPSTVRLACKQIFGRALTYEELGEAVGASALPVGTVVRISAIEQSSADSDDEDDDGDEPAGIYFDIGGAGVNALRYMSSQSKNMVNNEFSVIKDFQGHGLGADILHAQVQGLRAIGVNMIETVGAGKQGSQTNGYYTWPRLGYDGPLSHGAQQAATAAGMQVKNVSELMTTEQGRSWWKENGRTIDLSFDTRAGSTSSKVLETYISRRNQKLKLNAAAGEEQEEEFVEELLSPEEDELLQEVWEEVGLRNAASPYGKPGTSEYAKNYYLAHKAKKAGAAAAPAPTSPAPSGLPSAAEIDAAVTPEAQAAVWQKAAAHSKAQGLELLPNKLATLRDGVEVARMALEEKAYMQGIGMNFQPDLKLSPGGTGKGALGVFDKEHNIVSIGRPGQTLAHMQAQIKASHKTGWLSSGEPAAVITHELTHAAHRADIKEWKQTTHNPWSNHWKAGQEHEKPVAKTVSGYAGEAGPSELIAEMGAGARGGRTFSPAAWGIYHKYSGPNHKDKQADS